MMSNVKIKICGIISPCIAEACCQQDLDFIGIVFHKASVRYVQTLSLAHEIAAIARAYQKIPVGVFTDHTAKKITEICEETEITTVQLHGSTAKKEHTQLPSQIKKIYAVCDAKDSSLKTLDASKDKLIIDNPKPGSGVFYPHADLSALKSFQFFIAGGLSAENVVASIKQHQPYGVDVSSQVESSPGKKDLHRVLEFIKQVRNYDSCE